MPTLYMRAATHVVNRNPPTISIIESINCHAGTPKGIRIIIAIGDVNGIMDNQKDNWLSGLFTIKFMDRMNVKTNGNVMGSMNCCVSVSLSTAEPTAANTAL